MTITSHLLFVIINYMIFIALYLYFAMWLGGRLRRKADEYIFDYTYMNYKKKPKPKKTPIVCPGGKHLKDFELSFGHCFDCKTKGACMEAMKEKLSHE